MFVEGEWVETNGKKVGYVESCKENKAFVHFPEIKAYGSVGVYALKSREEILPEVKQAAKEVFVEMALMTRDEEWFMEVTR